MMGSFEKLCGTFRRCAILLRRRRERPRPGSRPQCTRAKIPWAQPCHLLSTVRIGDDLLLILIHQSSLNPSAASGFWKSVSLDVD